MSDDTPVVDKPDAPPTTALETAGKAHVAVEAGVPKPDNLAALGRIAQMAVESGLVGVSSREQAMVIMQRGAELGFPGLTAFEFLYVTGRKPRLTPAGAKAKALASGELEDFREDVVGEGENMEAVVTIKRRGITTPIVGRFSVADAKTARLWGKVGKDSGNPSAWVTYPRRMLLARARGFAFADAFPDLCGGLQVRERYDLEPGEEIAAPGLAAPRRKTGADPIFSKLGVTVPKTPEPPPIDVEVREPFPSHAEADQAIAESEK